MDDMTKFWRNYPHLPGSKGAVAAAWLLLVAILLYVLGPALAIGILLLPNTDPWALVGVAAIVYYGLAILDVVAFFLTCIQMVRAYDALLWARRHPLTAYAMQAR